MSEYLQIDVDPSALGFLSIFLGGSIIHKTNTNLAEESIRDVDWDGVGFVPRKIDIISLLRERRADLCDLLGVVEEDGSAASWEEALELAATLDWQVLRFSGWTRSGSKRTMKIWSQEHLAAAVSYPGSSYLGVLSHKTLHTIQLNQGALGPGILVCPPVQVTDNVYIMSDFDLIQVTVPADRGSETRAWPGILCDLLLTSRCMFESSRGLGASLKQLIWSKWGHMLHQNDAASTSTLGPAPFSLYRWASFGKAFKDGLLLEGATTRPLTAASPSSLPAGKLRTTFLTIRPDQGDSMTTSSVEFISYDKPEWNLQPALHSSFASTKVDTSAAPTPPHAQFVLTDKVSAQSPFSRNSVCERANLEFVGGGPRHQVFIKTTASFDFELDALTLLRRLYRARDLQRIIAVDRAQKRIYYEYFNGKSLLDIRFGYLAGTPLPKQENRIGTLDHRWLLSVEAKRAHDVMRAYKLSYSAGHPSRATSREARIHQYFFHRLHVNKHLKQFYPSTSSVFRTSGSGSTIPLDEFLQLPIYVNNVRRQNLQHYLHQAELLLHPDADHFSLLPNVYGLGDGHGGNIMVAGPQTTTPTLRYIDYEVAGHHSIVLDMAKPIYLDCFCNALWGDVLGPDLSQRTAAIPPPLAPTVEWTVEATGIHVRYELNASFLDKAMARTKFEYIVCPVLEHINGLEIQGGVAERVLAHALFCCAVLTRDFSNRPDLFFLNLAIGVELAVDMRGVIDRNFGPQSWPKTNGLV